MDTIRKIDPLIPLAQLVQPKIPEDLGKIEYLDKQGFPQIHDIKPFTEIQTFTPDPKKPSQTVDFIHMLMPLSANHDYTSTAVYDAVVERYKSVIDRKSDFKETLNDVVLFRVGKLDENPLLKLSKARQDEFQAVCAKVGLDIVGSKSLDILSDHIRGGSQRERRAAVLFAYRLGHEVPFPADLLTAQTIQINRGIDPESAAKRNRLLKSDPQAYANELAAVPVEMTKNGEYRYMKPEEAVRIANSGAARSLRNRDATPDATLEGVKKFLEERRTLLLKQQAEKWAKAEQGKKGQPTVAEPNRSETASQTQLISQAPQAQAKTVEAQPVGAAASVVPVPRTSLAGKPPASDSYAKITAVPGTMVEQPKVTIPKAGVSQAAAESQRKKRSPTGMGWVRT